MPISRVAYNTKFISITNSMANAQRQYQDAMRPATTGNRMNSLADDPGNVSRLLSLRSQMAQTDQFQNNLTTARLRLNFTDLRLSQTAESLERVREIALQANNSTLNSGTLSELATQIGGISTELMGYANAQYEGKYIFAGTNSLTIPFTGDPVVFNGNTSAISVRMSTSLTVQTNLNGEDLFMGDGAVAAGTTLATALRNSTGAPFNLQSGEEISIGGTVGGVDIPGGLTITSTTTLSDIASFMQTAIRGVGDGTEIVAVRPDGSLRVTTGTGAINDLTISVSGRELFNDAFTYSTPIAAGGSTADSEALNTASSENLFDLMADVEDAIGSGSVDLLSAHISRIDSALEQVNNARATIGTRGLQINALENVLSEDRLRFLDDVSRIQDADISEAYSTLTTKETVMRLVLSITNRVLSTIGGLEI